MAKEEAIMEKREEVTDHLHKLIKKNGIVIREDNWTTVKYPPGCTRLSVLTVPKPLINNTLAQAIFLESK